MFIPSFRLSLGLWSIYCWNVDIAYNCNNCRLYINFILHSCPGLATYWRMCKCYLLTYNIPVSSTPSNQPAPGDPEIESVRPSTTNEEELQLQLALAISKEEHDEEIKKRKGDEMKLQMALEESRKTAQLEVNFSPITLSVLWTIFFFIFFCICAIPLFSSMYKRESAAIQFVDRPQLEVLSTIDHWPSIKTNSGWLVYWN